ncbi:hypothetical protein AVEN_53361-1 [Araneus ventricosus]|uniref:RNase H type-1 domain-containing protein n=1 Tax=Araneus ventricosus TaxID=182803 RepID=A0A4Y2AA68_ARAVE|nr:hypothetical protein AVEN_53361-1 [Araneus ventricosus]
MAKRNASEREIHGPSFHTAPTYEYRDIKIIDSRSKILDVSSPVEKDFVVYTDGSRVGNNVGFSVCVFDNGFLRPVFCFKLNYYNSFFQVELSAINFAVSWALENGVMVIFFSDSLSSIDVLASISIKSSFGLNTRENILMANGLFNLNWVRAHAGNPGNELADHFATIATDCGEISRVPAPYSFLKKRFFENMIYNWNVYWNNSVTGVRVREFLRKVDTKTLITNRSLFSFATNHGPFPAYLFIFKLLNSPNCPCGESGDTDHFVFQWNFSIEFHLSLPAAAPSLFVSKLSAKIPFYWGNCLKSWILVFEFAIVLNSKPRV